MAGIYILENTINDKLYVGQTVNSFEIRFAKHQRNNNTIISHAIQKYGWDNFKQYTYYVPEELLDYFEVEMIEKVNSISPNGYNLTEGGRGGRPSKEVKKKLSEAHKGQKLSSEHKKKIGESGKGNTRALGSKHSEETKAKYSLDRKGQNNSMSKTNINKRKLLKEQRNNKNEE